MNVDPSIPTHSLTLPRTPHPCWAQGGDTMCLTAATVGDGGFVVLAPCSATDPDQRWAAVAGTVADASEQRFGWVSDDGSTAAGAQVWLYDVVAKAGYCKTHKSCSFAFDPGAGAFKNPAGNCVVAALSPSPSPSPPKPGPRPPSPPPPGPPPRPSKPGTLNYTCAAGSPEAGLPFCDTSLGFDARAEDLVNRLNTTEQVGFFFSTMTSTSMTSTSILANLASLAFTNAVATVPCRVVYATLLAELC